MLALNGADPLNGPRQWGSLLFCLVIVLSLQRAEGSTEETGSSYTKIRILPQQTVVDTYAKVGFAKLYDRKTPITAAEILNDRVVPFYDEHYPAVAHADRSWHRILRQPKPRIRALSRGRGHRSQPNQDQEPTDERNL